MDSLGANAMKNFVGVNEIPLALARPSKAETKLKRDLSTDLETVPVMKCSSLAKDSHLKTRETAQITDRDMREF